MNPILSAGLLIGVLCGAFTFVMGLTGWYKDPAMVNVFIPIVTLIEVLGLIWGLRKTVAEGRTYSGQVVAGTFMALVAGAVIICASLLFTMVVFPDFAATNPSGQTPFQSAMGGFLGTFMTGVIASAIIAIWIRARVRRRGYGGNGLTAE